MSYEKKVNRFLVKYTYIKSDKITKYFQKRHENITIYTYLYIILYILIIFFFWFSEVIININWI